ncbi:hypothetical protein VOLCADRAFT_105408 [Volvox carteri f. nagariensis]|uniref:Uncharacterized protein n=1 Tax=Volvox carteri f. nagariensis TaxID=3068 RepID=D8U0M6_VOLCA|nr:uncharacterized protein VOLCADRAFT_105408 [Volvox carteri f. nagariensis]EFJ46662.1 hypothetical protein VOLCADRAFT_105408 [Volvox carteri f. nagariensis]|eukprot:XP_002952191.1 hypothetical protein VOLCADRAFT_105408 [Volvox carteri f. nagariensis]
MRTSSSEHLSNGFTSAEGGAYEASGGSGFGAGFPPIRYYAAAGAAEGVLELYDLLLVPCTQSRLKPRNYISHPPRPRISLILPYSGRRLPYIVRHVVEPLLTCAAAAATTAGGNVTAAAAAAAAGPPMPLDFFELLVAFDDVHEAADWADISAESGGRRLAEMAVGEMLVVLRDGDGLSYDSYCSWLHHALQAFKAWPRLAVLGGPGFVPLDELDERQQMIVEAQRNQTTNRQLPLRCGMVHPDLGLQILDPKVLDLHLGRLGLRAALSTRRFPTWFGS